MTLEFSRQTFEKKKKIQVKNFMKIPTVEADLFRAEGQVDKQTDIMKLISLFRNISKATQQLIPVEMQSQI